jgi:PE-PPE domain
MGAAVGATTMSTALITGTTTTVVPPAVTLTALVTPANSTAQIFAGTTYYGTNQTSVYGDQVLVPFFLGPQGIVDAVEALDSDPETPDALFASGWGAGQAGTALAMMDDDDLAKLDVVVLDNDSNFAAGGFWTTYAIFAPLLLTSAEPTPTDLPVRVVDVQYQYNVNSSAPTNPLNPFATANTLVAYVYGYGGEQTAPMPPLEDLQPGFHYVVNPDGTIDTELSGPVPNSNVTYVTFKSDGLPLVRPLRSIPGGDILADALEPTLTELVEAGYQDGQSIPDDPSQPRPMNLFPSAPQTSGLFRELPGSVTEGVVAAQADLSPPSGTPTRLASATNDEPSSALPKLPKPTKLFRGPIEMTGGNKANSGPSAGSTSSTRDANPVRQVVERVSSAVSDVANGLRNAAKEDAKATNAEAP